MKKAFFIISIIINTILLPLASSGIFVYIEDPSYPLSLVLSLPCIPLSFLIISIAALKMDTAWYKTVLLKLTLFFFFIGLSFISFEEGYYAAILPEFIALVFLIITIGSFRISKKVRNKAETDMKPLSPYCYKGKWTWDDAAEEYLKISGKSKAELTDDDTRQIYRYSMMPVAYYFYWLLRKGFMSSEFYELKGNDIAEADLENNNVDVLGLLEDMDHCLHGDEMLKCADDFSRHYAGSRFTNLHSDKLVFDYYDEIKNSDDIFYCVDFSWDVCKRMYDRIDKAYERWSALFDHSVECYDDGTEAETMAKTLYSRRFRKDLEVYRSGKRLADNITDEYIHRCIADLDSIDEFQFERLDGIISDDYGDSLKGGVMKQLHPCSVYVFEPQNDGETAYVVSGEADFEGEHGFAFYVRNGIIFRYGYGYQFDDIYSPENTRNYEIAANEIDFVKISDDSQLEELADEGKVIRTYLIPLDLGGKEDESNMVYLTPLAVKEKELLDSRLQAIEAQWHGKLKYKYTAVYYDNKKRFVPEMICVRHDAPPSSSVFYFTVKVWY